MIASSLDSMMAASRSVASSLRLRSVISWKQLTAPTMFPPLSLIASMSTSAMPRKPSGRSMGTSCSRTETPVRSTSAHGALIVREQTAVAAEHSIRSAKPFIEITEFGRPAPQFGSAAVVSKNETVPVTNINGKRQLFEKPRGQFEGLFIVTQTKGDTDCICERTHRGGGSLGFAPDGTRLIGTHCTSILIFGSLPSRISTFGKAVLCLLWVKRRNSGLTSARLL